MTKKKKDRAPDARYRVQLTPPLKQSKGALTQEKILRAAIPLIATRGLHGLTYEAVAQASGTTRTLVQTYFRDRDALFAGCVGLARREFQVAVVDALQAAPTTRDRLRVYLDATFDWIARHRAEASVFVLFHHLVLHNDDLRRISSEHAEIGRERIEALLKENPRLGRGPLARKHVSKAIQNALMGSLYCFLTEDVSLANAKRLARASVKALLQTYLVRTLLFALTVAGGVARADIHRDALASRGLNLFCQGVAKAFVLGTGESLRAAGVCFDEFRAYEEPLFLSPSWDSVLEFHQVLATRIYRRGGLSITVKEFEKRIGPPPALAAAMEFTPDPATEYRYGQNLRLALALREDAAATAYVERFIHEQNATCWRNYSAYLNGFLDDAIGHYGRRPWTEDRKRGFREQTFPFAIRSRTVDVLRVADGKRLGTLLLVRAPFGRRRELRIDRRTGAEQIVSDETGRWGQLYAKILSPNPFDVLQRPGYFYGAQTDGPARLPLESYFGAVPRLGVLTLREVAQETEDFVRVVEWREGEVIEPRLFTVDRTAGAVVMAEIYTQLLDFLIDPRLSLAFNCDARDYYTCNDRPQLYDPRHGFTTESVRRQLDEQTWHRLHATGADLLRNARAMAQALQERDEPCLSGAVQAFHEAFGTPY